MARRIAADLHVNPNRNFAQFSCFFRIAHVKPGTWLGDECVIGTVCATNENEILPDRTVIYGSRGDRRIFTGSRAVSFFFSKNEPWLLTHVLHKEKLKLTIGVHAVSGLMIEPVHGAYKAFGVLDAVFAKVQPRADIILDLTPRRNKPTHPLWILCQCKCWF